MTKLQTPPDRVKGKLSIKAYMFQRVKAAGNLKAFCSVDIGKIKIHGCRIVQKSGQLPLPSLPQRSWMDSLSVRRFYPLVELPKHVEEEVMKAILRGWEEFERATA